MDDANVDTILKRFFAASGHGRHPETQLRYARVQRQLRLFLEKDGISLLSAPSAQLLGLEAQFQPDSAYARVLGAEELLHALPTFLTGPHLLPDFHDRLAQISLASRLAQWLCSRQLVERTSSWEDVVLTRAAAERARRSAVT
ncbi:hypothetical protein [Arthrobacter sp. Br18]|uniref:hypothetical protein n=1 Tax=Arthrobacter sp. Br18 TaxID=1312954 RepID=UPI0004ADC37F|nr:hypothetical protein [Arthrobacter sp. Br18]